MYLHKTCGNGVNYMKLKKCSAACLGRGGMGQGGSPKPLSGATLASHTDCAAPHNVHRCTVEKRNTSHIVHSERHCGESNKHLSHQEQLLPNSAINGHAVRLNCTLPHEINLPLVLCKLNSVKLPTCETHPIYKLQIMQSLLAVQLFEV